MRIVGYNRLPKSISGDDRIGNMATTVDCYHNTLGILPVEWLCPPNRLRNASIDGHCQEQDFVQAVHRYTLCTTIPGRLCGVHRWPLPAAKDRGGDQSMHGFGFDISDNKKCTSVEIEREDGLKNNCAVPPASALPFLPVDQCILTMSFSRTTAGGQKPRSLISPIAQHQYRICSKHASNSPL